MASGSAAIKNRVKTPSRGRLKSRQFAVCGLRGSLVLELARREGPGRPLLLRGSGRQLKPKLNRSMGRKWRGKS